MATKKTSKNSKKSVKNSKKSVKKVEALKVSSIKIVRARAYEDMYFFDMVLNGIYIYGCRLIEAENGWFVSFPSKKPTKKGGKWYNHCWAKLDEDTVCEICSEVMEICGDADDDDADDADDDDADDADDDDDLPF